MPKSKKARRHTGHGGGGNPKRVRKMHTFPKLSTTIPSTPKQQNGGRKNLSHQRPIVPFGRKDRILLIGEGDFSFAHSLVVQHRCKNVLATCYDSEEVLYSKYPQAEHNVQEILNGTRKKKGYGEDPTSSIETETGDQNQEQGKQRGDDSHEKHREEVGPSRGRPSQNRQSNVLFSVDARKLGHAFGGGKDVRSGFPRQQRKRPAWPKAKGSDTYSSSSVKGGPWDMICFNFPHVGGLSTDVNRQVRANQELLVAFFKACVPLLSSRPAADRNDIEEDEAEWDFSTESGSDSDVGEHGEDQLDSLNAMDQERSQSRNGPGQILVTLFEGEPYTLWNIKDLARHAGLRVITSFRFPWASYRGYSHVRTLGEIEAKHGGRGGWRGEDREARMYVFELREDHMVSTGESQSSKDNPARNKRSRPLDSDDSN